MAACLAIWLLFKQPVYICETNVKNIQTLEEFETIMGVSFKETDEGDVIDEIKEKLERKGKKK